MDATWKRQFGMWQIGETYFDRKSDCIRHAKLLGKTIKFMTDERPRPVYADFIGPRDPRNQTKCI